MPKRRKSTGIQNNTRNIGGEHFIRYPGRFDQIKTTLNIRAERLRNQGFKVRKIKGKGSLYSDPSKSVKGHYLYVDKITYDKKKRKRDRTRKK